MVYIGALYKIEQREAFGLKHQRNQISQKRSQI
jgi:hypothetical protein